MIWLAVLWVLGAVAGCAWLGYETGRGAMDEEMAAPTVILVLAWPVVLAALAVAAVICAPYWLAKKASEQ